MIICRECKGSARAYVETRRDEESWDGSKQEADWASNTAREYQ